MSVEYFRPADAKSVVGVSKSTIYNWQAAGLLTIHKHGGMSFVAMADVRKIINPMGDHLGDQMAQ